MTRKNNRNRHGGKWKNSTHAAKHDKKQRKPRQNEKAKPIGSTTYGGGTVIGQGGTRTAYNQYRSFCTHYQDPFDLGDGEVIYASAYQDSPWSYLNEGRMDPGFIPDVGFYLDGLWSRGLLVSPGSDFPVQPAATEQVMFPWRDRDKPADIEAFDRSVEWLFSKIRVGKLVDTGCFAAHGRTGTLLACMLVKKGMSAPQATLQVRREHCSSAIEGMEQVWFIRDYDKLINGREFVATDPITRPTQDGGTPEPIDEYGRRIAEPLMPGRGSEDALNNLSEADAYNEWLRLNAQELDRLCGYDDDDMLAAEECLCHDGAYLCPIHDKAYIQGAAGHVDELKPIVDKLVERHDEMYGSNWCYNCDLPERTCYCSALEGCM